MQHVQMLLCLRTAVGACLSCGASCQDLPAGSKPAAACTPHNAAGYAPVPGVLINKVCGAATVYQFQGSGPYAVILSEVLSRDYAMSLAMCVTALLYKCRQQQRPAARLPLPPWSPAPHPAPSTGATLSPRPMAAAALGLAAGSSRPTRASLPQGTPPAAGGQFSRQTLWNRIASGCAAW